MNLKPSPVAFIVFLLAGWISRQQLIIVEYLKAENRMLRERLNGRSLRLHGEGTSLAGTQGVQRLCKVLVELGYHLYLYVRCVSEGGAAFIEPR